MVGDTETLPPFEIEPTDWLMDADDPVHVALNVVESPSLIVVCVAEKDEMAAGGTVVVVVVEVVDVVDVVVDVDVEVDDVEVVDVVVEVEVVTTDDVGDEGMVVFDEGDVEDVVWFGGREVEFRTERVVSVSRS